MQFLLVAVGDSASCQVVGRELYLNLVAGEDADVVAPHLSGDMAQHIVTVFEFDPEHGVREGLGDGAFEHNRIFFMLWQDMPFRWFRRQRAGNLLLCHLAKARRPGRKLLTAGLGATPTGKTAKGAAADQRSMLVAPETAPNIRAARTRRLSSLSPNFRRTSADQALPGSDISTDLHKTTTPPPGLANHRGSTVVTERIGRRLG